MWATREFPVNNINQSSFWECKFETKKIQNNCLAIQYILKGLEKSGSLLERQSLSTPTPAVIYCLLEIRLPYYAISEKAMAPHSSTLAWKIPWTEEPGRLQSMGSLRVDMTERLHFDFSLSCIGEGNGNPFQCSCLDNPRDREAWWAAISGVAQSRTWLKWLSISNLHFCLITRGFLHIIVWEAHL